jgi:hypothetical protein
VLNFGESSILDLEQRHVLIEWLNAREARWVLHYRYLITHSRTHYLITNRHCAVGLTNDRGTRDGFSVANFHEFNDRVGPSISVVLSKKEYGMREYEIVKSQTDLALYYVSAMQLRLRRL